MINFQKVKFLFLILIFCSCSSKYIKLVHHDTKTEFGITISAPNQGIFFVENTTVSGQEDKIEIHSKTAKSIYNNWGPCTDERFLGRTNARQLKFILDDKTYLIDITKFKKRTAMILFDGKSKPIIEYNSAKYKLLFLKYFYYNKVK